MLLNNPILFAQVKAPLARSKGAKPHVSLRHAVFGALLFVPLTLAGCGSNQAASPTTNPGDTNDPAAKAKALEANPNVPPQAKAQMSRNLQSQQSTQPADAGSKK